MRAYFGGRTPWKGKRPFLFLDPPYDFSFNTPQEERIWRAKERAAAKAEGRHPRRPREEKPFGISRNLHRGFDHDLLKKLIERGPDTGNSPNLMITYNDKPGLREEVQRRWKGGCWHVFSADIDYSMLSTPPYRHEQKSRRELIITNYDPFA